MQRKCSNGSTYSGYKYLPDHLQATNFKLLDSSDIIDSMATILIRKIDEQTKKRLRVRAAHRGVSMEEEARDILKSALRGASKAQGNLAEAIHRRFAALGGVELPQIAREPMPEPPDFRK
jgi:plasmid stability protein